MFKLAIVCSLGSSVVGQIDNTNLRRKRSENSGRGEGVASSSLGIRKLEKVNAMAMEDIWEQTAEMAKVEFETERLLRTSPDMSMPARPPSRPTPAPSPRPTPPPDGGPTQAPVDCLMGRTREEYIFDLLVPITPAQILNDPSTPQGMAFDYLANEDPHLDNPCDSDTIEQRYGLTTFYYSTQGADWTDNQGWLGQDQECSWAGVECEGNSRILSRLLLRKSPGGENVGPRSQIQTRFSHIKSYTLLVAILQRTITW